MFNALLLQAAPQPAAGGFGMIMPLVLIVGIMYLFMIRPQQKKQKETQKMLDALKKGDKVVTIGGIHGTVASTKENTVVLKVDDNTKIEFNRTAIATVVVDKPAEAPKAEKKSFFGKKANKTEETAPAAASETEEK
ncbi:preprotein translocase subunit YajC [Treponema sp.]|uniref:preprotein translocase subunit YajC n=1 Tax=Treponema sp. TaxID=166 RepID=UPI00298E1517|nr:preprotein translocase subunit YajC [Treponema sp.]MCQ2240727.1 preprotein translocase subunit YajC [Treponema sp.]